MIKIYLDKLKLKQKKVLWLDDYLSENFGNFLIFDEPDYNNFIKSKSLEKIPKKNYYHFLPVSQTVGGEVLFYTHEHPYRGIFYNQDDHIDKIFIPTTETPREYFNNFEQCLSLAKYNNIEKNKFEISVTNEKLFIVRSKYMYVQYDLNSKDDFNYFPHYGIKKGTKIITRSKYNYFEDNIVSKFIVKNGTYEIFHIFDTSWLENIAEEKRLHKEEKKLQKSDEMFDAWQGRRSFMEWRLENEPNLHFICIRLKEN